MKLPLSKVLRSYFSASRLFCLQSLGVAAVLALGALPAHALTYNFDGLAGDGQYTTALNWDLNAVPNTSNGDIAVINNGAAVTYTPGGDLIIKNGGMLQVTSGSFTQAVGNNYFQLNGTGSIIVNGGTFNQGTASSTPFNVTGTGNVFSLSAGAVNLNSSFNINAGLTFTQSGGALTVGGDETDFNGGSSTLSGGTLTTKKITGVNGPNGNFFNISGGTLNLTGADSNGIYGGGTGNHYLNFTSGSTGQITFSSGSTTTANVQGFVNNGVIELNNAAANLSNFNIMSSNGVVTIQLAGNNVVPEPSTFAVAALGFAGLAGWAIRRRSISIV